MIPALIVLSIIVLFHEFGHYLFARLNGVAVLEFSLGYGPRLISHVSRRSGIRYSVKCVPFGGSCAMLGDSETDESETEDGGTGEGGTEDGRTEAGAAPSGKSFYDVSVPARIAIIAAGPVFNFILAFLFAMVITGWAGYDSPRLVGVMEGYPAEVAGLQAGDIITKIGNRRVGLVRDVTYYLAVRAGQPVSVAYKRYDAESGRTKSYSTVLNPQFSEEDQTWYLGLQWNGYRQPVTGPLELIRYGALEVRTQVLGVVDSLVLLIRGKIGSESLAGPVRIVSIIGESVEQNRRYGMVTVIMNLINIMVMFSANLGVINLLPFPALDGGRLVFLLWELVSGRPVDTRFENAVSMTGMALLMTFMVFVIFNDLRYLF